MSGRNVGSIVLMVLNFFLVGFLILPAIFLVFATDSCQGGCDPAAINAGMWIALVGPGVVFTISLIASIRLMVKKLDALVMSLIGLGGSLGAFLIGVAIVFIDVAV